MRLITCVVLVLVIMEGFYCIPSTSVDTTSSTWEYEYNLSDSRGFSAKYDDNNGFQIIPLDNKNNTGFKKKYTERTVHDQYTSNDDQPATRTVTVDEYVKTNEPASSDDRDTTNLNVATPNSTAASTPPATSTSSPLNKYGGQHVVPAPVRPSDEATLPLSIPDKSGEPSTTSAHKVLATSGKPDKPKTDPKPVTRTRISPKIVLSSRGQSRTSPNNPSNTETPSYPAYLPHSVPVGNQPGTSNVALFSPSYGYNVPHYGSFGAPVYNIPNPMYGVPNNQMYYSGYGQTGLGYVPTGTNYGQTGPTYGPTRPAYRPAGLGYGPSGIPTQSQNGQMYGPGYDQTYKFVRRPVYFMPQGIYN